MWAVFLLLLVAVAQGPTSTSAEIQNEVADMLVEEDTLDNHIEADLDFDRKKRPKPGKKKPSKKPSKKPITSKPATGSGTVPKPVKPGKKPPKKKPGKKKPGKRPTKPKPSTGTGSGSGTVPNPVKPGKKPSKKPGKKPGKKPAKKPGKKPSKKPSGKPGCKTSLDCNSPGSPCHMLADAECKCEEGECNIYGTFPGPPQDKPCSFGDPLTDSSGNQLFCGRGPASQTCPSGSSCLMDPADRYAVCCIHASELCANKACGDVCDNSQEMLQVMRYCQPDGSCATNAMMQCPEPIKQKGESCGSCMCPPTYTKGKCAQGLKCVTNPMIPDLPGTCT